MARRLLPLALIALSPSCEGSASPVAVEPAVVLWSVPAGDGIAGPVVVAGRVLVLDPPRLRALDPLTGAELWSADLGAGGEGTVPALTARGGVAYALDGRLFAARIEDGAILWSTAAVTAGFLATDEERLYAIRPGAIAALDPASGTVLWETPLAVAFGRAAVGGGFLCVAGETILCHDGASGRPVWSAAAPDGSIVVDLEVDAGTVVASTLAGEIVAHDRRTGTVVWRRFLGAGLQGASVAGLTVYACRGGPGPDDEGLCVALDESNGADRWKLAVRGPTSAPLVSAGTVIVVDGRAITLVDAATGRVIRRIAPPREGPFHQAFLAAGQDVLYARFFGELLALAT